MGVYQIIRGGTADLIGFAYADHMEEGKGPTGDVELHFYSDNPLYPGGMSVLILCCDKYTMQKPTAYDRMGRIVLWYKEIPGTKK